jgi:hypothetical protein
MCFLRECNVCASVRIFLKRNSFEQSYTERRAPQGGVRRCSVSTRCRTGTPGRWAGTRRGDAGADVHTPRQPRLRGKERRSWVVVRATPLSDAAAHGGVSGPVRAVVKRLGILPRSVEGVPTGCAVASVLAFVERISRRHRATSRPMRAYIHQHQPTPNANTLSDQAL